MSTSSQYPYAQRNSAAFMQGGASGPAMVVGLAIILGVLFAIGMWPKWNALKVAQAEAGKDDLQTVAYVVAKRINPKSDLVLPASLFAMQDTVIYARINGYLKSWAVDIGDKVKAGQVLAEIEAPEVDRELDQAHATLAQAKANLELARTTSDRYAALLKDEAVSPQEVDEKRGVFEARRADYAAVEANLRRLQQMKSFQRVVAPFSGTITARNIDVGSLIQAGSASSTGWLFKLAQTETIRVHAAVPQSNMRMIKPGMTVDLIVPELGERTFSAKVVRSAGAFDASTRTMIVEMHVPNKDGPLVPGMYAQARMNLVNAEPNLQIPINALIIGGDGTRVATVDAASVIHIKPVKIGRDFGKEVEVLAGLADSDRVINNPRDSLVEGLKVNASEMVIHGAKKEKEKEVAKPAPVATEKPKS